MENRPKRLVEIRNILALRKIWLNYNAKCKY